MDADVLVVGAGPTGLMLATQLARRGVRVTIVDRNAGPSRETRALVVHARSLEIYARLGIAEAAIALGHRGTGANLWANGRHAARIPLGDIGQDLSPFPYLLVLGQDDNERLLGEDLQRRGVTVQWNTELVGLVQDAGGVTATLKTVDGTHTELRAAWLAGCDGARSAVRERCGIAFEGAPYEHVFFVADVTAAGPMVPGELNAFLWQSRFHLLFPMRGDEHWRLVGILPPALRGRDDVGFDELRPVVEEEIGRRVQFRSCSWYSTYRIHHRRAARFREGRCFLLGDAAHIHSPVGAQGMNTGLQDAWNLAWKLALVTQERADAALLDSYESERVPVAERLLETTDRAFTLVVSEAWWAGLLRTRVLARVAAFAFRLQRIRRFAFQTISQIGIRYPESALSEALPGLPSGGPRPGDRFPWMRLRFRPGGEPEDLFDRLDDTRFHLLLFGQAAPAAAPGLADLLAMHAVPAGNEAQLARAGVPQPSFYLLRPDGHVGLAGGTLDLAAIERWFAERARLSRVRTPRA